MMKVKRRWVALLAGLAILGIAGYLRLWQLGEVPPFFHFDEGNNGADALSVLAGNHRLFFEANRGREGLIMYGVALFTALLGRSMLAARLTGALASTLAVLAVFWLGSVLFAAPTQDNEAAPSDQDTSARLLHWRPLVIGGVGAGVMAASLGLAILGRTGLRANFLPLLLPLAVGLLWTGMQRRSTWRLIAAGAVTGLLAYTYISARFFPFLLLLFGVSFLLPRVEGSLLRNVPTTDNDALKTDTSPRHPLTRSPAHPLLLFAATALLVALPMIIYFIQHPADFSNRSAEVWLFNSQLYDGSPLSTLLHNVWLQLSVLGFAGDPSWRSNYAELPLLHPVEGFFFWLGILALLVHWRKAYSRLLLLWLLIFLAPAVFSYDLPRNTFRMLAMAPAIYLTVGYGFWVMAALVSGAFRLEKVGTAPTWRIGAIRPVLLGALVAAAAVLIGVRGVYSGHLLFDRWAHEVEANVAAPNVEWVDLIETAAAAPAGETFIVPTSRVGEYAMSSFTYLYQGQAPVHMLDSSAPDFTAQLYELLAADAAADGLAAADAVDWDREAVADAPQRIPFLLSKYGQWQAKEERKYYTIDRYTNVDTSTPWTLYGALEPVTVALDGGISLTGLAAGTHGGEQIAAQTPLPADAGPLWLALRWQADQTPKANYRLSLRLFDAAGANVWQADSSLVDDLNRPTSQWQPSQVAESYHTLALPPDLPQGLYELRAIVYDETTLTPIVQVGIWTPEIVLGRVEK